MTEKRRVVMRAVRIVFHGITAINVYFMKGYRFVILAMMSFMLYEVVARYAFNVPTAWSYELTGMLFGVLWLFGAGYSLTRDEHIRLELLYKRLSTRKQGILDMVTWVFFWFYIGVIAYYGWQSFWFSFTVMERSRTYWGPLLWPWRLTVPIGCALLLLQGIVRYGHAVHKAVTGRELE